MRFRPIRWRAPGCPPFLKLSRTPVGDFPSRRGEESAALAAEASLASAPMIDWFKFARTGHPNGPRAPPTMMIPVPFDRRHNERASEDLERAVRATRACRGAGHSIRSIIDFMGSKFVRSVRPTIFGLPGNPRLLLNRFMPPRPSSAWIKAACLSPAFPLAAQWRQ